MKRRTWLYILLTAVLFSVFAFPVQAEENPQPQPKEKYYLGETAKTSWDSGYTGGEAIKEGDWHYGWKIGSFFVDGFTTNTTDKDENPVFLKNVGDRVALWFNLEQDINKLNGNNNLIISEDTNGYDEYFGVSKTNFKRGALIIRKTDYTNAKSEPIVYTDYLAAGLSKNADTRVELCEEGDYEVALDYEIKSDPRKVFNVSILPTYANYRIFFRFSVRNGNCMAFPFDVKTKGELTNTAITENGFFLDFAKSRYLDINIKKEVLNEGANGLAEDVRFNRPAKDGEQYTEEGIYTITVSNRYTGQLTTKKIYVGNDDVLKAVTVTGLSVNDVNLYVANGATIEKDGTITVANNDSPVPNNGSSVRPGSTATSDSSVWKNLLSPPLLYYMLGGAALIVLMVVVSIAAAVRRKRRKTTAKPAEIDQSQNGDDSMMKAESMKRE